jgi:hypothetical protein
MQSHRNAIEGNWQDTPFDSTIQTELFNNG